MHRKIYFSLIAVLFVSAFNVDSAAQTRGSRASAKRTAAKKPAARPGALSSGAVRTRSGLIYLITKDGEGPLAKEGDTVTVHYSGVFTDGKRFDSSRDRNRPIEIQLGQGRVIKGWEEGLTK